MVWNNRILPDDSHSHSPGCAGLQRRRVMWEEMSDRAGFNQSTLKHVMKSASYDELDSWQRLFLMAEGPQIVRRGEGGEGGGGLTHSH